MSLFGRVTAMKDAAEREERRKRLEAEKAYQKALAQRNYLAGKTLDYLLRELDGHFGYKVVPQERGTTQIAQLEYHGRRYAIVEVSWSSYVAGGSDEVPGTNISFLGIFVYMCGSLGGSYADRISVESIEELEETLAHWVANTEERNRRLWRR